MKVGVIVEIDRMEVRHLKRLDWWIDKMKRRVCKIIKGIGDYIGFGLAVGGFLGGLACAAVADSVPESGMELWIMALAISCIALYIGFCMLYWMRKG